jgi:phage baseplate assembly protein W
VVEPKDTHAAPKTVEALVRKLIGQFLFTNSGERVDRPDFGGCHSMACFFTQNCESKVIPGHEENVQRRVPG